MDLVIGVTGTADWGPCSQVSCSSRRALPQRNFKSSNRRRKLLPTFIHLAVVSRCVKWLKQRFSGVMTSGYSQMKRGDWGGSLKAFVGRLHWHCHFIQKLESAPSHEFQNVHRGYDGLRESYFNDDLYDAWAEGRTGYPFVDACMRSLRPRDGLTSACNKRLLFFLSSMAALASAGSSSCPSLTIMSPAFIGIRCRCRVAQPASTPYASTTCYNLAIKIPRVCSFVNGCRNCRASQRRTYMSPGGWARLIRKWRKPAW